MSEAKPLFAVSDPLGAADMKAVSAARAATLAQNRAGATRLEAANMLVQQFSRAAEAEATDAERREAPSRPAYARLAPESRARDHLAAACQLTCWHTERLVTAGVQIYSRLSRLRSSVDRGLVPEQLAIDIACKLAAVPDSIVSDVEGELMAGLAGDPEGGDRPSRAEVDSRIDELVARFDPAGAEEAEAEAAASRMVRFRTGRNGMADLLAKLPLAEAELLRGRIEAEAEARAASEDGVAAVAQGLPNRVEFVHGAYSSYNWLCQQLLEGDDASVRFELIDPAPGAVDSPDHALRYLISPAMAERIRLRDGTCRHPGCSVPARDCDVDHVIAFNKRDPELGGPTLEWNLVCLCRKHHREKTFGTNAYRPGPLGELIILTETGHRHRTRPRGPLARARDGIRERAWEDYADRLISADGYIMNPPGTDRSRGRPA
ncbi:HNH endonuclease signature motif containing protein [Dietzia lutea]|uniref:HNH nuclease domain-containing protein n=1 Tax=Dietzia lutea TaxID=546160 RepID=A0A2S1RBP5_9ACTN|nr:HNH endonuclease signature motif containing protein [Dietzia lutea]AWH93708.1 hypothetical protein A6035_03390 [Dietzia lutea]